jgi:glycosyltransferase involved in cell wall biosynthesis
MYPRISIITPSYNQGQYLEETILSVLNQNYPNLEYIIIDGGSNDNSVDIIKKYAKHLKYWVSEKDQGQTHAINKGLTKVTGEIINWLCSDDYLEAGALLKIAEAFGKDENIHVISGKLRLFNKETGFERYHDGTVLCDTSAKTITKSFISQPSTFFRTKYFLEAGLNNLFHWHMDYELWVKYLFLYGQEHFKKIDDLLVHYRFHNTSKTEMVSQTSLDKSNEFTIERNTIMYSIALNSGLTNKLDAIKYLSNTILEGYNIGINLKDKIGLANKVINYYLYYNAVRYYYEEGKKDALYLLRNTDKEMLQPDEKENYELLKKQCILEPYLIPLRKISILRDIKNIFSKSLI